MNRFPQIQSLSTGVKLALEDGVLQNYEYRSKKEEGALTAFQVVIATSFHFTLLLWRRTWLKLLVLKIVRISLVNRRRKGHGFL